MRPARLRQHSVCLLCRRTQLQLFSPRTLRHYADSVSPYSAPDTRSSGPNISRHLTASKSESLWRSNRVGDKRFGPKTRDGAFSIRKGRNAPRAVRKKPFELALRDALQNVFTEVENAPIVEYLEKEGLDLKSIWQEYTELCGTSSTDRKKVDDGLRDKLRNAHNDDRDDGLHAQVKYNFYAYITGLRFTKSDIQNQKAVADLRYPVEWNPSTRKNRRKVHLHVGPTNSGKTYHALKSLEAAESGIYAGPLRLLAHEIAARLNARGHKCSLVTGEERRSAPDPHATGGLTAISCTVEMIDPSLKSDVAVIDEIQMIGDKDRGAAWLTAMLSVQAQELHLCGEKRTVPLIKAILAQVGEEPIVHEYERLSPLKMDSRSLQGDLSKLRKGDCIVSFSVMSIHAIRRRIERVTGKKAAIVYGSLPPETRAQQARLFNNPDNDYDFLVASDAIGMGLNLSIKRIVFESSAKFNGQDFVTLDVAAIKQIAGRAGRYKTILADTENKDEDEDLSTIKGESEQDVNLVRESNVKQPGDSVAKPWLPQPKESPYARALASSPARPPPNDPSNFGLVSTLDQFDFPIISKALAQEPPPMKTAGIDIPPNVVSRFAQYFPPGTPFSYVLLRCSELVQVAPWMHLCSLRDKLWIADLLEPIRNISVPDRLIFTGAPASARGDNAMFSKLIPRLARCVEEQDGGALYDIEEIPLELLEEEEIGGRDQLRGLESLHKALTVYLWLSYRFAGIFTTRSLAQEVKKWVEERIEKVLESLSLEEQAKQFARRRGKAQRRAAELEKSLDDLQTHLADELDGENAAPSPEQASIDAELSSQTPPEDDEPLMEDDEASVDAVQQHDAQIEESIASDASTSDQEYQTSESEDATTTTPQSLDEDPPALEHDSSEVTPGTPQTTPHLDMSKHLHDAVETGALDVGHDAVTRP